MADNNNNTNSDTVAPPPPQSSSSASQPPTSTTTTTRITTTTTSNPPTSSSTTPPTSTSAPPTSSSASTTSAASTTVTTFTTTSWSLSTSGTATFSIPVPSIATGVTSPGASNDGGSSIFTPAFWVVTGAILGAVALLAGAICFIRGRVRNKRNDRVYRPGGFGGTAGTATGGAGAGGRAFQPGLGSAQRPSFSGPGAKNNASAGYAGGVVTLVELSDANPAPPQSPPLHPYGPTPPPTTQQQYGVPVSMPMQGYPSMPPAGAPEYGAYAYGDPNMPAGMPPGAGGYEMQGGYDPQAYPMMSSASPVAPAMAGAGGQEDGVITFAPTMQRDDGGDYGQQQQAPPGMEYRFNEHTGQQELHYVEQHHSGGQQQGYGVEMNRTGSPLNGNAPGVTRQLRLPGSH